MRCWKKFAGGYQMMHETNFRHTFCKYLPDPPLLERWKLGHFVPPVKMRAKRAQAKLVLQITQKQPHTRGGVRQKFAEPMPKICFGHHLVPTCKFFPKSPIFSSIFLGPTKFFPKMQFFSTKDLGPTYFLSDNEIFTAENMGPTHIPTPKNRHSIITKCR